MLPRKLRQPVYPQFPDPVVETAFGKLRGLRLDGIYTFRGIPYAQAERFELARPCDPWGGIRSARCWGHVSPELHTAIASDEAYCPHNYWRADEHCQYLNLWTPTLDQAARLPVVVWMHGGGWVSGSSVEQLAYDGENFSRSGRLVMVNFNSRQNCLGALDLSSLGEQYRDSVYCGLSDVLEAMRWIRDNIACFGGDPDNVTVVGQAGGGKRALALMQAPAADGLYHKVALGSCAGERMLVPPGWTRRQIAQYMGRLTASALGFRGLASIRTIPYWQLAQAVLQAEQQLKWEIPDRFRWEPIADGIRYFDDPFATDFRPETSGIPMLIGSSYSEMAGNSRVQLSDGRKNEWDSAKVQGLLNERYGLRAHALLMAFRRAYPDHPAADLLFIDQAIRSKLCELTRKRAAAGERVWNWLFQLEFPIDGGLTAWHCSETPFVLGNAEHLEASYIPGVSEPLQELMSGAWAAFAWNGDPNGGALPQWPRAGEDTLPTMLFGTHTTVRNNHDRELQALLHQRDKNGGTPHG